MTCDGEHLRVISNVRERLAAGLAAHRQLGSRVDVGLNQAVMRLQDELETANVGLARCLTCLIVSEHADKDGNNCRLWLDGRAEPLEGRLELDVKQDARSVLLREAPVNTGLPVHTIPTSEITKIEPTPYESRRPA